VRPAEHERTPSDFQAAFRSALAPSIANKTNPRPWAGNTQRRQQDQIGRLRRKPRQRCTLAGRQHPERSDQQNASVALRR